jgi:hypothetical protein
MDDGVQFAFDGREPAIAAAQVLFLDVLAFLFIKRDKVRDLIWQAGVNAKVNDHGGGSFKDEGASLSAPGAGKLLPMPCSRRRFLRL